MPVLLVPAVPAPEIALEIALKNIVEGIADLLQEEGLTVANEWAEAADVECPNIFMKEKAVRLLAARLLAFVDEVVPEPNQFTSEHVDAYLTPLLPPTDNPKPEPK